MIDYENNTRDLFYDAFQTGKIRMARKPFDAEDTTSTDFFNLPQNIKDALVDLPEVPVDDSIFGNGINENAMGFFGQMGIDSEKHQFYILSTDNQVFFVYNQGYDYARYVTELINIKFED